MSDTGYTPTNVAFVGTHQHAGVGGYLENLLPQVTSLGYVKQTVDAIVEGTILAVKRAHASLASGQLSVGNTTILDANINRSPTLQIRLPRETDINMTRIKGMTVLRFDDENGNARGLLSFFAVHGTSLYEIASVEPSAMPGNTTFVVGFTQSNVGDTSPNTIIGEKQFEGALTVMNGERSPDTLLPVEQRKFINFASTFDRMAYIYSSSNSDGPGAFDFTQGDNLSNTQNPFRELVKGVVTPSPSETQVACQYPKPILLNTGYAHTPYDWAPNTVDVQMLRVGNFVMVDHAREALRAKLMSSGVLGADAYVVIAGPANTYDHYVTTREEYSVQRYGGASTIFGQFTLEAYVDKYSSHVPFLADNASGVPDSDPAPVDQTSKAIPLQPGVVFDAAPNGQAFGDVLVDVNTTAYHTGDTVIAQFVGANPRNNLRLESTFLTVDQLVNGQWRTVRSDSHPSTTYQWARVSTDNRERNAMPAPFV
ncbi:hypothetical protein C0995_000268 [Termitomyces sp. Mi166|nr:hypothetical protein C0995_000268 [Termitomyces sp. Mi166\